MTAKTYDPASYGLAEHFLQDEPNLNTEEGRDNLAKTIQTAVEDWFEERKIETEEREYREPDSGSFEKI